MLHRLFAGHTFIGLVVRMNIKALFEEKDKEQAEEIIANTILFNSSIRYEDVPILIEKAYEKFEIAIGYVDTFAVDYVIALFASDADKHPVLGKNRYIILKKGIDIKVRRYILALAMCDYLYSDDDIEYIAAYTENYMTEHDNIKAARTARALLIPQKSLSTLLFSPMLSKADDTEKISSVETAFLVPNEIASERMRETGILD